MRALSITRMAGLAIAISLSVSNAPAQPRISSHTIYTVKPERTGDFQAAVKDINAIFQKAGVTGSRMVWQSASGPVTYILVQEYSKWAELEFTPDPKLRDSAAALTAAFARLNQCTENRERRIVEVQPDISLPRSGDIAKYVRGARLRVRPERIDDYIAALKSDLLPAAKKAGLKTWIVMRTRYGGPSNEFFSVSGLSGWADLDGQSPIVQAMGQDAYRKYVAKVRPMLEQTEYNMYRYRPDLSLVAAGPPASNN